MNIKKVLEQLSLDQKEVAVYTALLEIGESNVVPVSKKVNLPRNTVVYILEGLEEKGLIRISQRGSRHVYIPEPPKVWTNILRNDKEKIEKQLDVLEGAMPELNKLFSVPQLQPQVKIFRGRAEIRKIYEEMLEESEEKIYYVGEYKKIADILGDRYLRSWIERRIKKGISTVSIRVKTEEINEPIFQASKETKREIRYAPKDFESPGHVSIYGNKVAIITSAKENFGVVVTSKEYALIMKNWFDQLRKVSK